MNCETRPKPRTKFSPWFGLFHVNLGCFIDYDIHEFVKALEKTKDRSASFFNALAPSTKNGAGAGMLRGCECGRERERKPPRFTVHPDATGGGVFKPGRGG